MAQSRVPRAPRPSSTPATIWSRLSRECSPSRASPARRCRPTPGSRRPRRSRFWPSRPRASRSEAVIEVQGVVEVEAVVEVEGVVGTEGVVEAAAEWEAEEPPPHELEREPEIEVEPTVPESELEGIDDPVRMYLREIGRVPLLTPA